MIANTNDTQRWFGQGSLQVPMATSIGMDASVTSFGYNMYVPIIGISGGKHVKSVFLETETAYLNKRLIKALNGVLHRPHGPCE